MRKTFTPWVRQLLLLVLFIPSIAFAQSAEESARQYISTHRDSYKLTEADISNLIVRDKYLSSKSGITHVYFAQGYKGIEVFNGIINVNVGRDGKVISMGSRAVSNLGAAIKSSTASLTAVQAVQAAASSLSLTVTQPLSVIKTVSTGPSQEVVLSKGGISLETIPARLVYQPLENGDVRLAWDVAIYQLDAQHWWNMRVDAASGAILSKNDWVAQCQFDSPDHDHAAHVSQESVATVNPSSAETTATSTISASLTTVSPKYRVFNMPHESPSHGGRTLVDAATVINKAASPFGWHDVNGIEGHDFNIARGNNVHAYWDGNNLNSAAPTLTPADGGLDDARGTNHTFDFPADLNGDPLLYRDAAITNLFYWSNLIHETFYQYGFDEVSGNFQQNNYGKGGLGADQVFAEAQDGSGANNANFATPPDGRNPRMQMFLWTGNPRRDGDFDNGVIVHEYGHGISNRLTGGPSSTSCLSNQEQMGEGWSDWFGLMMTMKPGDFGAQRRGIGTYVLYQPTDGKGIRPAPYSTDFGVNNYTYKDIKGLAAPHGVGFVWSTMLWEVTWALVDKYGFDADIYNGKGGNNKALELVTLALKLQPCSPGFIDGRDAILKADSVLYGGANYELIYRAFAKRGLGFSADQGSSSSKTDGVEAYDMPTVGMLVSVDNASIGNGGTLTYTLTAINRSVAPITNVVITNSLPENTTFVSASDGGTLAGGVVTFPAVNLGVGEQAVRTLKVKVNSPVVTKTLVLDDIENDSTNLIAWKRAGAGTNVWGIDTTNTFSGVKAWFVRDEGVLTDQYLIKSFALNATTNNHLSFWHEYDTEVNYDGGVVELSLDGGVNYTDLGPLMVKNGYNSGIAGPILGAVPAGPLPGRRAFSGQSGDFINTIIDLSQYSGQTVTIRWRMGTDVEVGGIGWWLDDVATLDVVSIKNEAHVTTGEGYSASADLGKLGTIVFEGNLPEPIKLAKFEATGKTKHIALEWITSAESNNAGFELQRREANTSFAKIAWIDSKAESRSNIKYKYNDNAVVAGTTYFYRLRQVDIYGNERFSYEVSASTSKEFAVTTTSALQAEDGRKFTVYPNPAQSTVTIAYDLEEAEPVLVTIYNVQGQKVYTEQVNAKAQRGHINVNLNGFSSGMYIIKAKTGTSTSTHKIIVNK
ncbi:extracellular elastinolytic metalloproteinase [Pontibacter aydingkolensis]|uniref:M36 family metallopeptidase n=1 Tax=Pontibacter aydingkolensis TaxID=1911536 RepID=A0ABS7CUR2_9BACT|nr:M36 family metallopeptidase [Pontibacter aydingkolensis]MBW7467604.1 M36 family metallopeptidase [Pontibacter aydingkolensis]